MLRWLANMLCGNVGCVWPCWVCAMPRLSVNVVSPCWMCAVLGLLVTIVLSDVGGAGGLRCSVTVVLPGGVCVVGRWS